jgi:hypothetical protein
MKTDPAYHQGQIDCQKNWSEQHPDYWRQYRDNHPDYSERNRELQRKRNRRMSPPVDETIAKMDELTSCNHIETGKYLLVPFRNDMIAKMDELVVQLSVIPNKSFEELRAGP